MESRLVALLLALEHGCAPSDAFDSILSAASRLKHGKHRVDFENAFKAAMELHESRQKEGCKSNKRRKADNRYARKRKKAKKLEDAAKKYQTKIEQTGGPQEVKRGLQSGGHKRSHAGSNCTGIGDRWSPLVRAI